MTTISTTLDNESLKINTAFLTFNSNYMNRRLKSKIGSEKECGLNLIIDSCDIDTLQIALEFLKAKNKNCITIDNVISLITIAVFS